MNFLLSNYQIVLQLLQVGVWSSDRYNGQKQLRLLALIVLVEAWWMIEDNSGLDNCRGPNDKWVANCKFKEGLCFYFVECNYLSGLRYYWNCTEVHKSSAIPVCCDLACADR